MAKDPAFLFYPGDWQGGTTTMSRHLKGCYLDLLIAQFNSGPLSLEEIKTVLGNDFALWGSLSKKFAVDETDKYFNERLEAEKLRRKIFLEKQFLNGKKGGRKPNKTQALTQTKPKHKPIKENENENENKDEILLGKSENLFYELTENELKNSIEYLDRVAQKKFTCPEAKNLFAAFKLQYEKDFYPNRNRLIQHFRNWLKQQHGNTTTSKSNGADKPGTSEKRIAALKAWGREGT